MKLVMFTTFFIHLPSLLLLLRQHCVVAGNNLISSIGTMIKYVRCAASGAVGSCLGITIKYLRRTRTGAAGDGLGTTAKYP